MGYPMTWRRLVNRNRLHTGDYTEVPEGWFASAGAHAWSLLEKDSADTLIKHFKMAHEHQVTEAGRRNSQLMMLAGDLRRLERDTVDEGTICQEIARKLDFDPEMVAAVLREWLAT